MQLRYLMRSDGRSRCWTQPCTNPAFRKNIALRAASENNPQRPRPVQPCLLREGRLGTIMTSWDKWALGGSGAAYYFGDEEQRAQVRGDDIADAGMGGRDLPTAYDWATAPSPTGITSTPSQTSSQPLSRAPDTYRYREFMPGLRKPIRLLAFARDKVHGYSCSLSTFELHTAPPFQALSYTWGCPVEFPHLEGGSQSDWKAEYAKEALFLVDGGILTVTPGRNLDEAFRRLWNADLSIMEHKHIWVDAICINQKDDAEKAQQMLIMGDIYRKATKVIAWLGLELPTTSRGIVALQTLGRIPKKKWPQLQTMDLTQTAVYAQLGILPITSVSRQSLSGILTRG